MVYGLWFMVAGGSFQLSVKQVLAVYSFGWLLEVNRLFG
jgi:hypothetical protein